MTKMLEKRVLWISTSILILSVLLLVGATYAWFTVEVVSSNNIIKTGNLAVDMEYNDGSLNAENKQIWKNASVEKEPIINLQYLEPGFRAVRYFKITNKGNLAFKYQLNILASENYEKLGDAIDVYVINGKSQPLLSFDAASIKDKYVGTLSQVINSANGIASGVITSQAGSKDYEFDDENLLLNMSESHLTLLLVMKDDVDNTFMNKSIDNNFTISLHASQISYENDDFGNNYDAYTFNNN